MLAFERKRVCGSANQMRNNGGAMIVSADNAARIAMKTRWSIVLPIVVACTAVAQAQQSYSLSKDESANAQMLASHIAALSPKVDRTEATVLAESAYANVSRLRQQYRMFGTPIFNNFLVYHGFRKRGYCYQWTEDLLIALDALKLKTLELHWGESYAGTWRENNCLVVTAKGQPFESGIILDAWRHFGHLRWHLVLSDEDRYFENAKWAGRVRSRAASKTVGANRHVALQSRVESHGAPSDRR
jgi:hypothetical protein